MKGAQLLYKRGTHFSRTMNIQKGIPSALQTAGLGTLMQKVHGQVGQHPGPKLCFPHLLYVFTFYLLDLDSRFLLFAFGDLDSKLNHLVLNLFRVQTRL